MKRATAPLRRLGRCSKRAASPPRITSVFQRLKEGTATERATANGEEANGARGQMEGTRQASGGRPNGQRRHPARRSARRALGGGKGGGGARRGARGG